MFFLYMLYSAICVGLYSVCMSKSAFSQKIPGTLSSRNLHSFSPFLSAFHCVLHAKGIKVHKQIPRAIADCEIGEVKCEPFPPS